MLAITEVYDDIVPEYDSCMVGGYKPSKKFLLTDQPSQTLRKLKHVFKPPAKQSTFLFWIYGIVPAVSSGDQILLQLFNAAEKLAQTGASPQKTFQEPSIPW